MSVFLTGTDTGVGKTYTAVHLLRLLRATGLRCAGMKPICCGDREDAELLLEASSEGLSIDEVNPIWLKTPAAPLTASRIEEARIETPRLLSGLADLKKRYDFVVVEGVGGWLVPISENYFVADLAVEMNLPVMVVAMNRLGCLNHTLLTVRSVEAHGLDCGGILLNSPKGMEADIAVETNSEILEITSGVPILPGLNADLSSVPANLRQCLGLSRNRD
ncbi:MAG: dethiobiotin synthase [Chthoniobacterales bacterium]